MWHIHYEYILDWLDSLDRKTKASIYAAFELLEREGPNLGRPLVDTLENSHLNNLKELRPASSATSEIRILFVFDYERKAVMLLGGDKSNGKNNEWKWNRWYRKAIPKAEEIYKNHLAKRSNEDV